MQEQLPLLVSLQAFDRNLMAIINEKQQCPARLKVLDEKILEISNRLKAGEIDLEGLRKEHRELEREIGVVDSKIAKSTEKLSNIKSNKEYQAALKEIDDFQQEKQLLEDQAIEMMEKIEDSTRTQAERAAESREMTAKVEKERMELEKHLHELDKTLKTLLGKRQNLCRDIDGSLLKRYEQLLKRKGGSAVSAVTKGVCQCCHIAIPPQKFIELIKGEEMMNCPHCMRIIYWGDDERYKSIGGQQG